MIAHKLLKEIVLRGLLIAVMLFNAFAPMAGRVSTVQAQGPEPLATPAQTETTTTAPPARPLM